MLRNKSNLIVILAILLAGAGAIGLIGLRKPEIKNIDSRGKNIICFGDSITWGYGANSGEDYPSMLAKMVSFPVINAGIDGDTTVEAVKRFDSDVSESEPLLVIIEFGGNDFLRKIPQEITLKNIREMVDKSQGQGAMVAIADISSGMFLKEYRTEFSKLAKEKQVIFIPGILSGIITNPSLKSDFIHPNAGGYRLISQRVYRAIISYLNKNTLLRQAKK